MTKPLNKARSSNYLTTTNLPLSPLLTPRKVESRDTNALRQTTNRILSRDLYSSTKQDNSYLNSHGQTDFSGKESPYAYSRNYENDRLKNFKPKHQNIPKAGNNYTNGYKKNPLQVMNNTENGWSRLHLKDQNNRYQYDRQDQQNVYPFVSSSTINRKQHTINENLTMSVKLRKEKDSQKDSKTSIEAPLSERQKGYSYKPQHVKSPFATKYNAQIAAKTDRTYEKNLQGYQKTEMKIQESYSVKKNFLHQTMGSSKKNRLLESIKAQVQEFQKKSSLRETIGTFGNYEKEKYKNLKEERNRYDTYEFHSTQLKKEFKSSTRGSNQREADYSQTLIGESKTPRKTHTRNKSQHQTTSTLRDSLTSQTIYKNKENNKQDLPKYHQPARFNQTSPAGFSFKKSQLKTNKAANLTEQLSLVWKDNQYQSLKVEDFHLGKCKGEGRFGKVFIATHKESGFLCGIKQVKKATLKYIVDQFIQQIKIQFFMDHPNVVKLYGIFSDEEHIYLAMEFLEEGSLYSLIKKEKQLPQKQSAIKLAEIASGLSYMHNQSIVHRDIKPQNIVMTNGICKICDFGWAAYCSGRRNTYCGTLDYVSPEVLKGEQYDSGVDIWCYGVLAYEIMVGKAPFYNISRQQTMKKIQQCDMSFPAEMSIEAQNFIKNILQKNPDQRNTIQRIVNDRFLTKYKDEEPRG